MTSVLGIAVSGLNAAEVRVAVAADNLVNIQSNGFVLKDTVATSIAGGGVTTGVQSRTPGAVVAAQGHDSADVVRDIVDLKAAQRTYEAAAATVRVAEEQAQTLLDAVG